MQGDVFSGSAFCSSRIRIFLNIRRAVIKEDLDFRWRLLLLANDSVFSLLQTFYFTFIYPSLIVSTLCKCKTLKLGSFRLEHTPSEVIFPQKLENAFLTKSLITASHRSFENDILLCFRSQRPYNMVNLGK